MYKLLILLTTFAATLFLNAPSSAQQDPAYIYKKKNKNGFVYKSDTRPFTQRPQDTAAKDGGWSNNVDRMVLVKPKSNTLRPYYIDAFEALASSNRAWSVPGQTPTDRLMFKDAQTMCKNAGKRICTTQEWQTACRGGHTKPVKFNQIQTMAKACDFARANPYTEGDFINKTDSHPSCTAPALPLYHMIGNMAEFTTNERGQIEVVGLTYYDTHITNKAQALQQACEIIVHPNGRYPATQYNKGTGFRCCKDAR